MSSWVLNTVNLPITIDGWIGLISPGQPTNYPTFVGGATPNASTSEFYWLAPIKKITELPDSARPHPLELKTKYSKASALDGSVPVEAQQLITLLIDGGLFALWKYQDNFLGWTQKQKADLIPATKQLYKNELAPPILLKGRLKLVEEVLRLLLGKQISH